MNIEWPEPLQPGNSDDEAAAEKLRQCKMGWFAEPIYGTGDYPEILKKQVKKKCLELGLEKSSLPEFTEEEIKRNKGEK